MNSKIIYKDSAYNENDPLDVIIFAPHPDDAELFAGGLIAKLCNDGKSVGIIDLSLGEMSSRGSVEERILEAQNSSKILKIKVRINLCIEDTQIAVIDYESHLKSIVWQIRKLKPSMLVLPFGDTRHPDHWKSKEILDEAVFFANLNKKWSELGSSHNVKSVIYYMLRKAFEPSFITNISDVYETKLSSINCFGSQVTRHVEGAQTLLSDPLSISSIKARDEYYGSRIGVKMAEPYYISQDLSISDPFDFFTNQECLKSFLYR